MTYIISYTSADDSNKRNLALLAAIKQYPRWATLNNNTYIVSHTERTAAEIRNQLNEFCSPNDSVLVMRIQRQGAWRIPNRELREWLMENIQ